MQQTFDLPHNRAVNGAITNRSISVSFGDGYGQRAPDGINQQGQELNIECPYLDLAQVQALNAFVDYHGGHKPFFYTPNDGRNQRGSYILVQPIQESVTHAGGEVPNWYSRQLKFKRVYDIA